MQYQCFIQPAILAATHFLLWDLLLQVLTTLPWQTGVGWQPPFHLDKPLHPQSLRPKPHRRVALIPGQAQLTQHSAAVVRGLAA